MKKLFVALALGSSLGLVGTASADVINTDSPEVLKGRLDLRTESALIDVGQDNAFGHTATVYFSPTDRLQFGAGLDLVDLPGSGARNTGYVLEALYEGPQPAWMPFAWGIKAEYGVGALDGLNDLFALKGIAAMDVSGIFLPAMTLTLNLTAATEVGGGRDDLIAYNYNTRALFAASERLKFGFEVNGLLGNSDEFGDLGSLTQLGGVVGFLELPVGLQRSALGVEGGVLFGLNEESPDTVGKLNLTFATQF